MEFSPFNPVVRLCIQGMDMEAKGKAAEAMAFFKQSWDEASNDFEKFLAAHYLARQQKTAMERLQWLQTALQHALKVNDSAAQSALPSLYSAMAKCYEDLHEVDKARVYKALFNSEKQQPTDKGPFYHGTRADLQPGDLLTAGGNSNYKSEIVMNHIYFTALVNGAGLAAAMAKGEGRERVYRIEPTGDFENDPNLTDQKFPGNPTRSYRSAFPLKIVGEVEDWKKPDPADLQKFRDKVDNSKGHIIN